MELIDPSYDNSLPSSWSNINYHGSPDAINSATASINEEDLFFTRVYPNPFEQDSAIVLCEVWNVNDTPHESNTRKSLEDTIKSVGNIDEWVGFEQEYTLYKNEKPLGWPIDDELSLIHI